ncbi:MAG: glycosyltransferase family protein [Gaiellaceae bacterium]
MLVRHGSIPPVGRHILTTALEESGCEVHVRGDEPVHAGDSLVLVQGNARWFPEVFRSLLRMPAARRPFTILWQFEPLPLPRGCGFPRQPLHLRELAKVVLRDRRATDPGSNLRRLRALAAEGLPDLLLVNTTGSQETLSAVGVEAETLPTGYHPIQGRELGLERDIDVLFLGALEVPRRRRVLRRLRRAGIHVLAMGSWRDPRFWGEQRMRLVNRAKIFLNVSRFPGQFSEPRLILGMANGCLVVSEPMYRPDPFVESEHFVSAPVAELPELIDRYLRDAPARARIALRAHEFVTRELTTKRSVARLLELAHARSS